MNLEPWHSYIKSLRLKRGYTLDALSEVTKVPAPQLCKIEGRTKPPTYVQSVALGKVFSCFPEDLFCERTGLARTIREVEAAA